MNRFALLGLLLVMLSGCIQQEAAFEYEDVKDPCNVVAAGEIRAIYGFRGMKEVPVVAENYTLCMFSGQTTANATNPASRHQIMVMYVPYAQDNETILGYFGFENESEVAFIDESGLGIGDQSFLSMSIVKGTGKIQYMAVVVLKKDSAIVVADAGYPLSGAVYANREKLKQVASIALSRLTS